MRFAAWPRVAGALDRGLHDAARHPVRRDVPGPGARAPAGRRDRCPPAWPQPVPARSSTAAGPAAPRPPPTRSRATAASSAPASDLERQEARDKTGVFTGAWAVNPVNGESLPVFVADYVLMGYGTGAIMAVPGQDQRDWDFATVFGLPIRRTVQPPEGFDGEAYVGSGAAINSANDEISLNGLGVDEAKAAIIDWLAGRGDGEAVVQYKLRDWLFSRQRYWGEPFPVVYAADGETDGGPSIPRALPDADLPVVLPDVDEYSPKTFAPDDRDSRAGVAAGPRHRVDLVRRGPRVGPGARAGRSTSARPTRCRSGRARAGTTCATWTRSNTETLLSTPTSSASGWARARTVRAGRPGRRRPVRRRRRARGAAPAVRPVLAEGAVRPGARVRVGALPPAVQPGLHPGLGLHRRARACTCRPRRSWRPRTAPDSRGTASPSPVSTGRWASRCATSSPPTRCATTYGADTFRLYEMSTGPDGGLTALVDPRRRRLAALPAARVAAAGRRARPAPLRVADAEPAEDDAARCCTARSTACAPTSRRCTTTPPPRS